MKRVLAVCVFLLVIGLPVNWVAAKSYSIDEVQIRGWIDRDGTMLVNELFTYSFDGDFSKLTRAFPAKHRQQINKVLAFEVQGGQGKVGFVEENNMRKLPVTLNKENWETKISQTNGTIQVMYIYYVENAVISYDTYSDLQMTFFEKGSNHDVDMEQVQISYVLPEEVGEQHLHGYLYASNAEDPMIHSNGIQFYTPVSEANTMAATRMLFPSSIMTNQTKSKAPISLEEVVAGEEQRVEEQAWKVAQIPTLKKVVIIGGVLFGLFALFTFWMRSRGNGNFGSIDYVMKTDPLYLSFVDHSGMWFKGSFLAGLFSLVDKGDAGVELTDSAQRFQDQPGRPVKTLQFHLNTGPGDLSQFERQLVIWLFKGRLSQKKFHLHDIAEGKESRSALKKQHAFEIEHGKWHDEVKGLLVESGTLSKRLSYFLRLLMLVVTGLVSAFALYIGGDEDWGWTLVLPAIFFVVSLFSIKEKIQKWPSIIYFVVLLFLVNSLTYEDLVVALSGFIIVMFIAFYLIPPTVLSSKTALHAKMSMNKFRKQMKHGMPVGLSEEEQQRFLIRAYLLKPSNKKLPRIVGAETATIALASLFMLPEDPLQFVHSTWGPSLKAQASSSDGSTYDGGGYSGSGGGDGGGGAGAD
ncbi:DUF2207 domain-containing protein [Sporosarcina obsidiansis]|uniref:DUF2207 domain-containing protein n=1 Tax=Sporosarcina obsidiansis TaxID=2660748 RepID=UPI001890C5CB|nr:DUF2207 domain-containing protein [Sporosarcina obsidiansis]